MYGYIYLTTNLINGKKYIGRRTSKKFLGEQYLGSGTHIKNAIQKYGKENFSVELLEMCDSWEQLVDRETYHIIKNDAVNSDLYYNMSYGGPNEGFTKDGNNIAKSEYARKINSEKHKGKKRSKEFCEHQRQLHLGKPSGMKGHKHSDETKKLIGERSTINNLNRDKQIYINLSNKVKGNKMMNKDGKCIRVYPNEFETYLSAGWVFGGLPHKGVNYTGKNNPMFGKSAVKGRKWIHKNLDRKYVFESELSIYLSDGWELGMK